MPPPPPSLLPPPPPSSMVPLRLRLIFILSTWEADAGSSLKTAGGATQKKPDLKKITKNINIKYFYFMGVVFCLNVCLGTMRMQCPGRPEEGTRVPFRGLELYMGVRDKVLLAAEPCPRLCLWSTCSAESLALLISLLDSVT